MSRYLSDVRACEGVGGWVCVWLVWMCGYVGKVKKRISWGGGGGAVATHVIALSPHNK